MVFNPLFLQVVNNQETPLLNKPQKLTGPSYLFSDIIKVQLDKNETGSLAAGKESSADNNLLSSIVSVLSSQSAQAPLVQLKNAAGINLNAAVLGGTVLNGTSLSPALAIKEFNKPVLLQQMDKASSSEKEASGSEDIDSLVVGNAELFNFINDLLTNHQFDGKVSIVNSEGANAGDKDAASNLTDALPAENLTASEVLSMLKKGNTIAVENSAFQSSNGLLITLVELSRDAANIQNGSTPVNPTGQETTPPEVATTAPVQTLSGLLAPKIPAAETEPLQGSGPLYKLKFSLVNNSEVPGSEIDAKEPILKFPFINEKSSPLKQGSETQVPEINIAEKGSIPENNTTAVQENLTGKTISADESPLIVAKDNAGKNPVPEGTNISLQAETDSAINKIAAGTLKSTEPAPSGPAQGSDSKTEDVPVNKSGKITPETSVESVNNAADDSLKDSEIKAGKFITIERVKKDPGLQAESISSNKNIIAGKTGSVSPLKGAEDSEVIDLKPAEGNVSIAPEKESKVNQTETDAVNTGKTPQTPLKQEKDVKTGVSTPSGSDKSDLKTKAGAETLTLKTAENEDTASQDTAVKTNVKDIKVKEPEVKTGKFINIEKIKTDSGIQAKETHEPEMPKTEVQKPEMPEGVKKDMTVSNSGQNKTQTEDVTTDKKMPENQKVNLHDLAAVNPKEKDSTASSLKENQDTQAATDVKAGTKDSTKNEMNSSSKEENHQGQENTAANDRLEAKGKPQEDHSFSVGTQMKTGDETFTVKRTMETSQFGEASRTVKAAEVMKEISKFIQQGDKSSIVLKIDPENLGTVKIALEVADKVVHANIEVENEAARRLMENNLNQLHASLSQNGVQLNSLNISLANQEQKQGRMPGQKRGRAFSGDSGKDTDDIGEIRQKQMGYNTYDYLI